MVASVSVPGMLVDKTADDADGREEEEDRIPFEKVEKVVLKRVNIIVAKSIDTVATTKDTFHDENNDAKNEKRRVGDGIEEVDEEEEDEEEEEDDDGIVDRPGIDEANVLFIVRRDKAAVWSRVCTLEEPSK